MQKQQWEYLVIHHLQSPQDVSEPLQKRLRAAAEQGYKIIDVASSPRNNGYINMIYTLEREKEK